MEYLQGFTGASMNTGFYSGHSWTAPHRSMTENHIYAQSSSTVQLHALQKTHSDVQRRRKRTTFSKAQLVQLERTFSATQYPDNHTKETLSFITGLPESKIQVWFQNRRARYFKSKKASRKEPETPKDLHPGFTVTSSPSFPELAPFHPPTPGLSSLPGCPAPSLPQSTRLSTILDRQVTPVPAPPPVYPSPSCSPQEDYYQQTLRAQHCYDVFPSELDLPDDFEAVLREAQGSNPTVSGRWSAADNPAPTERIQGQMIHQNLNRTELSNVPLLDLLADPTWPHPDVSSITAYHLDC